MCAPRDAHSHTLTHSLSIGFSLFATHWITRHKATSVCIHPRLRRPMFPECLSAPGLSALGLSGSFGGVYPDIQTRECGDDGRDDGWTERDDPHATQSDSQLTVTVTAFPMRTAGAAVFRAPSFSPCMLCFSLSTAASLRNRRLGGSCSPFFLCWRVCGMGMLWCDYKKTQKPMRSD